MKNLKLIVLLACSFSLKAFQKVDINLASSEQIGLLPGVGDNLAKAIILYRQKHKRIASEEELAQVQGMTPKKLEKIMPQVVFGLALGKKAEPFKRESIVQISKSPRALMPLALLEKKAVATLGLSEDLEKDMAKRARHSAWLPRLGLAFDLDRDTAERNFNKKVDKEKRGRLDMGLGLRATFDLPQLIFNREELEVANLAQRRLEKREKLYEKIHALYFRYQRLNESLSSLHEEQQLKDIEASLDELAATLDSLSEGEFSAYQKKQEQKL